MVHIQYSLEVILVTCIGFGSAKLKTDIESDALKVYHPIIESLKKDIPQYHTRTMRKDAFELFGLASPCTKKSILMKFYFSCNKFVSRRS